VAAATARNLPGAAQLYAESVFDLIAAVRENGFKRCFDAVEDRPGSEGAYGSPGTP
jgi:hypothetical protein